MAIIDFPANIPLRAVNWRQQGGVIRNRSEFTGATRDIRIGPAARWTCDLEFVQTNNQAALITLRGFLAQMAMPGEGFRLIAVEEAQTAAPEPPVCYVNGGGQLGFTLNVDGLINALPTSGPSLSLDFLSPLFSADAFAVAGSLISVALPNGDEQLIALSGPILVSPTGTAAIPLATPLRQAPADNAVVRLLFPVGTMRLDSSAVNWNVQPGRVYGFEQLTAEEWF